MTEQTDRPIDEIPLSERHPRDLFRPSSGKVILVRNKVKERTRGGLFLTEERIKRMQEQNVRATVMCIGAPEITDYGEKISFEFEEGDEVLIDPYCGRSIEIPGTDMVLTLARFGEVMGKFLFPEPEVEDEEAMPMPQQPALYVPQSGIIIP